MAQRQFIPGSPWLYFKLYTGYKTADDLLTHTLRPYLTELYAEGTIDGYFFIRYGDPDFHLRLRLHLPSPANFGTVLDRFHRLLEPCVADGRVKTILCDTYNREIERYGDATIEPLEELFRADSAAIMELLSRISESPEALRETLRWQLPLLLLDDTLTAFGYDLPGRLEITTRQSESFKREFGFTNHAYTKQLNDKYRAAREPIAKQLATPQRPDDYAPLLDARREQFEAVARHIATIRESVPDTTLTTDALLPSIQHMTINRWFRSNNRLCEMVLYDYLRRYYESALARQKHQGKPDQQAARDEQDQQTKPEQRAEPDRKAEPNHSPVPEPT